MLNAKDSVVLDEASIKAATATHTNDKINVEKKSVKRKHEDGREYSLKRTNVVKISKIFVLEF